MGPCFLNLPCSFLAAWFYILRRKVPRVEIFICVFSSFKFFTGAINNICAEDCQDSICGEFDLSETAD